MNTKMNASGLQKAVEDFGEKVQDFRRAASDTTGEVEGCVKKHPLSALAGALAVGYATGRILKRKG